MQYTNGPWAFDAALGYGQTDYQRITRQSPIFATGRVNSGDSSDSSGDSFGAVGKLSYDLYSANGLRIGPMLQVDTSRSTVGSYTEQGSDSSALRFDDFSARASHVGLEPRARWEVGTADGLGIEMSALYLHDIDSDESSITARSPRFAFINHSNIGRKVDQDSMVLNLAMSGKWGPLQARQVISDRQSNDSRSLGSAADISYGF